jgi:hypothetical protein
VASAILAKVLLYMLQVDLLIHISMLEALLDEMAG